MQSTRPKLLEVKNLRTSFFTADGEVKAVDDISYNVHEGEIVGIVGESGCGKSVSVMSVMRLIAWPPGKIMGGEAIFQGEDVLAKDSHEMLGIRGNNMAMIFQEPMTSLNPVLTVGRQMNEALELHKGLDRTASDAKAAELLDLVGIPDAAERLADYPHQFSGGQRQRIMIAMALSCDPALLIADEPTTALDVTIQAQILELMQKLNQELGTAVIIITHNLGVVARYADWVNVMYAGRIIESGPAHEIYANPMHPYTRGLLASVPRLDEPLKAKLVPIEGMPPDLIYPPSGCYFRPRCPVAVDKCREEYPPVEQVSPLHSKTCWVVTAESEARSGN